MRPQYPCDSIVRISIRDSGQGAEFECFITTPRKRPELSKSAGSRHLQIDDNLLRRSSLKKKSVRFDEESNEFHAAEETYKEGEEKDDDDMDDSNLWYNNDDFEVFTHRIQTKVEKLCESMFSKSSIEVLERTQQTCMAQEGGAEENAFSTTTHDKELTKLIETYNENDIVGLEPYVAEYMPGMVDHFERHEELIDEVLNDDISKFMSERHRIPIDQKSRHVSFGSRLFAHRIAQAAAESIRQDS